MKVCTECLVDLLPSLENPANDMGIMEELEPPTTKISLVIEAARPFVIAMQDKFPDAATDLVVSIGESIWRRRQRIRLIHDTKARVEEFKQQEANTVPEATIKEYSPPSSQYSDSVKSDGQSQYSRTTKSSFSAPSIFDKEDKYNGDKHALLDKEDDDIPVQTARIQRRESVSSVRSSLVTNAPREDQRHVPAILDKYYSGIPFECFICLKPIKDIQSRDQWK